MPGFETCYVYVEDEMKQYKDIYYKLCDQICHVLQPQMYLTSGQDWITESNGSFKAPSELSLAGTIMIQTCKKGLTFLGSKIS